MPKLLVSLPDGTEATHELVETPISVGRLAENTLQIEDASVSSQHAELKLDESGDYILTDLGSTNGTEVNGRELPEGESRRLQAGDRIRFGNIETSYESENPADARAMPAAEGLAAVPASSSTRPKDFANASPFQTKKKKKDPVGKAIVGFSILAMVTFAAAVAMIFSMKSPL